jgi:hypothetical protein
VRYLTKSRFSLALECPTKLDYADDRAYANADHDNEFLKALAEGGHQVGALAKCLFAEGVELALPDQDAQVAQTAALLQQPSVTLFEAAIRTGRLFIRADVLRKQGDLLELYEVKAKGYDSTDADGQFVGARGGFVSGMKPYLYDVTFQRYVLRTAFPHLKVRAHLVMPDKARTCPEAQLSQRLAIRKNGRRVEIDIDPSLRDGVLARQVLSIIPVDSYLDRLEQEPLEPGGWSYAFPEGIEELARRLDQEPFAPRPGNHCKSCQFRAKPEELARGLLDGRQRCWAATYQLHGPVAQSVFDLYSFRKTESLLGNGTVLLADVEPEDVGLREQDNEITTSHRQWLQCEESRGEITRPFVRQNALLEFLGRVRFPLHFIDFETSRPALPFHAGRKPYEQLLFQFSHHQLEADGTLRHSHQHLSDDPGRLPSFDTVRALAQALGNDSGTVLHWWDHERTVLGEIAEQLAGTTTAEAPDRDQLIAFIATLRGATGANGRLLDLGRTVHRTVFLPGTRGSSSLKRVLPALLALSDRLRGRYSQPIYGSDSGIPSLNFRNQAWLQMDANGNVRDPYKLLGERVDDPDLLGLEDLEEEGSAVADGGAAMVAYGLLQTGLLDQAQRQRLRSQLLRYCELDTLAMVFAWEALDELYQS